MIDFTNVCISQLSIHHIGHNPDDIWLSKQPVEIKQDEHNNKIAALLLKGFNMEAPYELPKTKNVSPHRMQELILRFFYETFDFHEISKDITEEFARTVPEDNKSMGELIIAQFHNVLKDGQHRIGLGIFKTNITESLIQLERSGLTYSINVVEGINTRGLQECVLLLQAPSEPGIQLYFKKNNYDFSSFYFIDRFLKARPIRNSYYNTANQFNIVKSYLEEEISHENPLGKIDKMKRSEEYFKNHDNFNSEEFDTTIFENRDHIAAFEKFKNNYARNNNIEIVDEFEISSNAVKKNSRYIRSVIKLDRNFHIYVHGNRQNIVRGYDPEKGMHYYQLFFEEET